MGGGGGLFDALGLIWLTTRGEHRGFDTQLSHTYQSKQLLIAAQGLIQTGRADAIRLSPSLSPCLLRRPALSPCITI